MLLVINVLSLSPVKYLTNSYLDLILFIDVRFSDFVCKSKFNLTTERHNYFIFIVREKKSLNIIFRSTSNLILVSQQRSIYQKHHQTAK